MLKVFQLRVARSVLGLGVRDIGAYIDLSRSTVSKIERKEIKSNLDIKEEQCIILIKIFNDIESITKNYDKLKLNIAFN